MNFSRALKGGLPWLLCMLGTASGTVALAQQETLPLECGTFKNNFGPFDYRVDKGHLWIVEQAHFPPQVEALKSGKTGTVAGALDYTLRAFPNHPRALLAFIRLWERDKIEQPWGAKYPIECYLIRAEVFRPDDPMPKMLYGIYKLKRGDSSGAITKLEAAGSLDSNNANLQYNLGLAYFRLKRYDEALAAAHKAYALGFQLPGLRNLLKREGQWKEPPEEATATSSSLQRADLRA